jgi:hypothetical protein
VISIYLQFEKSPGYLDKISYSDKYEAGTTQKLMEELPELIKSVYNQFAVTQGPRLTIPSNTLLGVISTHLLTARVGPWKIDLLHGKDTLFTLEYNCPSLVERPEDPDPLTRFEREDVI